MIIVLYGPDAYRRAQKKKKIVDAFLRAHSAFSVRTISLEEEGSSENLRSLLGEQSMFEPQRLLVIENAFAHPSKETAAILRAYQSSLVTILFSESEAPSGPFAFLKSPSRGKKNILVERFEYLTGAAWERFVREEAARREILLDSNTLRFVAQAYAGDTWRLVTELEKLSSRGKRAITREDLGVLDGGEPSFWELIGTLKGPHLGRRLGLLEKLLSRGEPAAKLFHLLAYQWSEKLPLFARYDGFVKSGKFDYEEALVDLLIS